MGSNSPNVRARSLAGQALHALVRRGAFRQFRHVKRGTAYVEIGRGEVQSDVPIHEGDKLVVYVGEDGNIWLRPVSEFDDGRFEALPALGSSM